MSTKAMLDALSCAEQRPNSRIFNPEVLRSIGQLELLTTANGIAVEPPSVDIAFVRIF
jgi:hypothetical protein